MLPFVSGGSSDTAGPSFDMNLSPSKDPAPLVEIVSSPRRSARIKAIMENKKAKEHEHAKPSFLRQFSAASSSKVRVTESAHRAATKARVAKAKQSKAKQTPDVDSHELRDAIREAIARRKLSLAGRRKRAASTISGWIAEVPPGSSTIVPSCETFIDPDDSIWEYRSNRVANPGTRAEYVRIPNCEDTNSSLSATDDTHSAPDRVSVDSKLFKQYAGSVVWRGTQVDEDGFRAMREYRETLWEEHKEWLTKRYGPAQAGTMIKLIESSQYNWARGKRVFKITMRLRESEERAEWTQFLSNGAEAALSALKERDMAIRQRKQASKSALPASGANIAGDSRVSTVREPFLYEKFEAYESAWDSLLDPAADVRLCFRTIPWPTAVVPESPDDIVVPDIWDFILCGYYGSRLKFPAHCRLAANEELRKWSPGQVMTSILPRVREEERDAVLAGADAVFKAIIVLGTYPVYDEQLAYFGQA